MIKYIDDIEKIKELMTALPVFEVRKKEKGALLIRREQPFFAELELPCADIEQEYILVKELKTEGGAEIVFADLEEKETGCANAEGIRARVTFLDYGPVEKESASAADHVELCCAGAGFKKDIFGAHILNEAEKKLLEDKDYISLLLYRRDLRYLNRELLENAQKKLSLTSELGKALDVYNKEMYGITGRKNLARLKKALDLHAINEFDGEYYTSLCREAVKDLEPSFDKTDADYISTIQRVGELMAEKGFSGEYPLYEKGDSYVHYGIFLNNGIWGLYTRFGKNGDKRKRFKNSVTDSDTLTVFCSDDKQGISELEAYICDMANILDGKAASKEFKKLMAPASMGNLDKGLGIFFLLFGICVFSLLMVMAGTYAGGFVKYFLDDKFRFFDIIPSVVLVLCGIYLIRGSKRGRYFAEDKGERI